VHRAAPWRTGDARICVNLGEGQLSGRRTYLTRDSKAGGLLVGEEVKRILSIQAGGKGMLIVDC